MKSTAVALQCSGAGAPEVVQHFYQIFFRADVSHVRKFYQTKTHSSVNKTIIPKCLICKTLKLLCAKV